MDFDWLHTSFLPRHKKFILLQQGETMECENNNSNYQLLYLTNILSH